MTTQQFLQCDADSASPGGGDLLTDQLFWAEQAGQVVCDRTLLSLWRPRVCPKQYAIT